MSSSSKSGVDRIIDSIEWMAALFVGIVAANIFLAVFLRKFFDTSIPDSFDFGRMLLGILILGHCRHQLPWQPHHGGLAVDPCQCPLEALHRHLCHLGVDAGGDSTNHHAV